MKKLLAILSLMLLPLLAVSQSVLIPGQQDTAVYYTGGAWTTTAVGLIYLPWDYNTNSNKYPLIISLPGDGEKGNNVQILKNNGLPWVINEGHYPYSVDSKGDTTKFIVLSIQPPSGTSVNAFNINDWWNTILTYYHLRIDTGRIYITGYSAGGNDLQSIIQAESANSNGWHIKAAVDMSSGILIYSNNTASYSGKKVWFFHGMADSVTYDHVVTSYNTLVPVYPSGANGTNFALTYYVGGHSGWTNFYEPTWVSPSNGTPSTGTGDSTVYTYQSPVGFTLYNWLMQYGGSDTTSHPATDSVDYSGNQVMINFGQSGFYVGTTPPWNNTKSTPVNGLSFVGLSDSLGNATSTSIKLIGQSWNYGLTGKGASGLGAYPDNVLITEYEAPAGITDTIQISGLTANTPYHLTFLGSSTNGSAGLVTYSAGGKSVQSNVFGNTLNKVSLDSVISNSSGVINATFVGGTASLVGYLNSMVIYKYKGYTPSPTDTLSYQIPVSNNARFWNGDTIFYQVNDPSSSGIIDSLFDEQDSLNPQTVFTSGTSTRVYYPATVVLDLGGMYKITKMSYYDVFGTDTFCIDEGSPYKWDSVAHVYENGNGWKNINDTFYTRYLHIYYKNTGNQKVRELKLYGYLVSDSLTRTPPTITIPTKTDTTMGAFMGVNHIAPSPVDSVGSLFRHYNEYQWIDTVTTTHNVDSVKFVFSIFGPPVGGTSSPAYYFFPEAPYMGEIPTPDTLSTSWTTFFDCMNGMPTYLSNIGLVKPIDPAIFPDRDSTNALEYTRLSRLAWTYAALWGSKSYPKDSMQTPYPQYSGLNKRKYFEEGNEYNQDWSTTQNHYSPAAYTAYASAFYDGDKGKMGSRMGAKTADSSMVIVMAGTAGADTDYLKGIQYASYYNRPDHSIPFDVINFHTYATNGSNGGGTNPHASSPEIYFAGGLIQSYINTASYLMPGKPIWITEWGYDRNGKSPLSVPPISGQDSAQTQAAWIARFWFMLSFTGIQRSTIFQLHNDPLQAMYDTLGYTTFNTTGLADGHYVGNQFSTQNATSWYAYPVWYFQSTIWRRLFNYKPDTIFHANVGGDSLYVYRYVNVNYPDSVAYAVWSGTQTNRILNNYVLRTGHSSIPIEQVTMADKYMDGVDTVKSTDANGNLAITITESPKLYFTTAGSLGGTLVDSASSQKNVGPTLKVSDQSTIKDTTILQATATPGNSPVISYKWTQLSGPGIRFSLPSQNQNNSQVGNVNADSTYTFRVTAMDANGLMDSKIVTLNGSIIPPGTKPRALLYIINGKIVLINN